MIKSVRFWPRWRAENAFFGPNDAVISITCRGQAPAELKGIPETLRLQFYDLVEPVANVPEYGPESLFTPEQARQVVNFVARVHADSEERAVVVHCEAGIRRSAAIALYVATATGCEFSNRAQADKANTRVIRMLEECSGQTISIPPPLATEGTLILLPTAD